jgi:hypothetical protein
MIAPRYNGKVENPLSPAEAKQLTLALDAAHHGDDYHNADVFGAVIHFGDSGYLGKQHARDPQAFEEKVTSQIEELQAIIAPHIVQWVAAKHCKLGVENQGEWELWQMIYGSSKVMHTSGIILGIAGVKMERVMHFDYDHPTEVSKARVSSWANRAFKIGVLLDTTHATPAFSNGIEAPDTDRMLVPVRGFPRHRESFSGLWSWQLSGADR